MSNDIPPVATVHACAACKKYKRRCDKSLPSCSLCSRLSRECDYTEPEALLMRGEDELILLRARVEKLENEVNFSLQSRRTNPTTTQSRASVTVQNNRQTAYQLFFLDSEIFDHFHFRVEPISISLPKEMSDALYNNQEQLSQIVSHFFGSVHAWMPIISKMRLRNLLDLSANDLQADAALLLVCMKLLLEIPGQIPAASSRLYVVVKRFSLYLEMEGLQSLMTVQSNLLISIYELGHAIYPSAYMTIAHCARQSIALGIHQKSSPQLLQKPQDFAGWEERLRVWWFVMLLDRYVSVGSDHRPLCTEEPKSNVVLPGDDVAWDRGEMVPPERLFMTSSATTATPFTRLAQASHLLGRVIIHCYDKIGEDSRSEVYPDPLTGRIAELELRIEEMTTLQQAASSFIDLIAADQSRGCYVAEAMSFSALMKLHDSHSCDSFIQDIHHFDTNMATRIRQHTERSFRQLSDISVQILDFALRLEQDMLLSGLDQVSPLVLHCIYRAATMFSYLSLTRDDAEAALRESICKRLLQTINIRWKAAGAYLEILESAKKKFRENN